MKARHWLCCALLSFVVGCAAIFGEAVPLIDKDGKPVMNPDGTPALVYKEGGIQKLTRAIAPLADTVPYGSAILALLGIVGAAGAGVQTIRARGKLRPDDVRKVVDAIGPLAKDLRNDQDVGDLVGAWMKANPDSAVTKLLQKAFNKDRAKNGNPPAVDKAA